MMKSMTKSLLVVAAMLVVAGPFMQKAEAQQYKVLNVPLRGQETDMWCWAATTQMSVQYTGTFINQCAEANVRFNRADCCTNKFACAMGGWPEYPQWGYNAMTTAWGTALSWAQIKNEIDANRPVNFSWGWAGGGGHIMVAQGYYDTGYDQWVLINDPWPVNTGATKWISYAEYVGKAGSYSHWLDYYQIVKR